MDLSSTILLSLAGVAVRALVLALAAAAAIVVFRMKSAASRHAMWTVVTAGMLAMAVCEPLLPPLPLRILKAAPETGPGADLAAIDLPPAAASQPIRQSPPPARPLPSWTQLAAAAYALIVLALLVRLAFSYLFTRRLLRASRAIDLPWADGIRESTWIAVPLTLGWLRPSILLPIGWDGWEHSKLQAVLAHERTHIERADWAIALMAGVNRAIFWFHPLAWWLERHLAMLAEQACDDAALQLVDTAPYAQALLDMAAAVKTSHGRLVWEAMAMANVAEVKRRIERILDETRQIPRGLSRSGWTALIAGSLPLIYFAAVLQLAPAQAQQPAAIGEILKSRRALTPGDAAAMEQYLQGNPNDLEARTQLILYYFNAGIREPRLTHIFWLVTNHPESSQALFTSRGITLRTSAFNDASDFARALSLWKQQATTRSTDRQVLSNAADFLTQPGGDLDEADRLLRQGRDADQSGNLMWSQKLGKLYAAAILGTSGDARFPNMNPAFAARVRSELDTSTDRWLLQLAGGALASAAQRPAPGKPLPDGTLNLDDHPLLVPLVDLGNHYMARAKEVGGTGGTTPGNRFFTPAKDPAQMAAQAAAPIPTTPVSTPPPMLASAPALVNKTEPEYPALARQARIEGVVKLMVTIGADGHLTHMQVISGHPLLMQAAMEAVKQWVYSPIPAAGRIQVDVPFTLPPGSAPPSSQNQAEMTPRKSGGAQGDTPTIRIGGAVQAAKLVHKVEPVYPEAARSAGIEGAVVLDVTIGADGKVQSVEPKDGHPILAGAAVDAVKQWEYAPTLFNGTPCVVMTTVTVTFQ